MVGASANEQSLGYVWHIPTVVLRSHIKFQESCKLSLLINQAIISLAISKARKLKKTKIVGKSMVTSPRKLIDKNTTCDATIILREASQSLSISLCARFVSFLGAVLGHTIERKKRKCKWSTGLQVPRLEECVIRRKVECFCFVVFAAHPRN